MAEYFFVLLGGLNIIYVDLLIAHKIIHIDEYTKKIY